MSSANASGPGPNTNGGLCHCGCGQAAPIAKETRRARGDVKGQPVRFVHGHNQKTPRQTVCQRGHDLTDPANVYVASDGDRQCRICTGERFRSLRQEALVAYGGACAECGSTDRLELDHVNGGGGEHRRAIAGNNGGGPVFFYWLKAHGWPNDPPLQVLCQPCHARKTAAERRAEREAEESAARTAWS